MILQALNQYYERLKDDPQADIPSVRIREAEDPFRSW